MTSHSQIIKTSTHILCHSLSEFFILLPSPSFFSHLTFTDLHLQLPPFNIYPNCSHQKSLVCGSCVWGCHQFQYTVTGHASPTSMWGKAVCDVCIWGQVLWQGCWVTFTYPSVIDTQASPINLRKLKQSANHRLCPSQLQLLMDVIINRYPIDTCSCMSVGDFILRVCAMITNLLSPLEGSYLWAAWRPHRCECRWTDGACVWDHLDVCCF